MEEDDDEESDGEPHGTLPIESSAVTTGFSFWSQNNFTVPTTWTGNPITTSGLRARDVVAEEMPACLFTATSTTMFGIHNRIYA